MTANFAFSSISGSDDDFQRVVTLCESLRDYCLIGGLAVNCYVEPVYTMDADFALAGAHQAAVRRELARLGFELEEHPHSLNATRPGSQLRIQFTRDERYADFSARAEVRETLGVRLRVASLPDLVRAKIWAWSDPERRLSKRKKDELDLIRIAEKHPQYLAQLPEPIRLQLG